MRTVLDASALLAALLREPGAERVAEMIEASVISAVNLAEVAGGLVRNGATAAEARGVLKAAGPTVIAADESLGIEAGLLRTITDRAGLSLGDRFCLALAKRLGSPALTTDRQWLRIAEDVGVKIELIR